MKDDVSDSYLEAVDRLQRIRYLVVVVFAISRFISIYSSDLITTSSFNLVLVLSLIHI